MKLNTNQELRSVLQEQNIPYKIENEKIIPRQIYNYDSNAFYAEEFYREHLKKTMQIKFQFPLLTELNLSLFDNFHGISFAGTPIKKLYGTLRNKGNIDLSSCKITEVDLSLFRNSGDLILTFNPLEKIYGTYSGQGNVFLDLCDLTTIDFSIFGTSGKVFLNGNSFKKFSGVSEKTEQQIRKILKKQEREGLRIGNTYFYF